MVKEAPMRGVIQKIHAEGKHGPYAIASVEGLGSVTFSLDGHVWFEEDSPEPGEIVMLSKLRQKRAGWRAMHVRYVRPDDARQSVAT